MTFMQHYVRDLRKLDWDFEFSDDHAVYLRGAQEVQRLRKIQQEFDASGTLWNQYATETYKVDQQ